ncbi:hypothetical protein BGX34_008428 [Mortierella sp. NVP85]|nr:hypothetical protein BGX34_008428 [Mortierella sp. NVP85]
MGTGIGRGYPSYTQEEKADSGSSAAKSSDQDKGNQSTSKVTETKAESTPKATETKAESTPKATETKAESKNEPEAEDNDDDDDDSIIDHQTFDQLLEMDDEEDHEFSKSLVFNYFEQAEKTFGEMDEAMKTPPDFANLSRLGHFLKGSSAALGLIKVRESCEKLQHYGNRKDASGINPITNDEAKDLIETLLVAMKAEYKEAKDFLQGFYAE